MWLNSYVIDLPRIDDQLTSVRTCLWQFVTHPIAIDLSSLFLFCFVFAEYFSRKNDDTTTTTDSSILETLPTSAPSSASIFCPWSTMVSNIYSVLLVIDYLCCY